jgi:hypothetical protein
MNDFDIYITDPLNILVRPCIEAKHKNIYTVSDLLFLTENKTKHSLCTQETNRDYVQYLIMIKEGEVSNVPVSIKNKKL